MVPAVSGGSVWVQIQGRGLSQQQERMEFVYVMLQRNKKNKTHTHTRTHVSGNIPDCRIINRKHQKATPPSPFQTPLGPHHSHLPVLLSLPNTLQPLFKTSLSLIKWLYFHLFISIEMVMAQGICGCHGSERGRDDDNDSGIT